MNLLRKIAAFVSALFATIFLASIADEAGGVINPISEKGSDDNKTKE